LGELRRLLQIRSSRQLGFFLLASDKGNGPYTRFTIPKRDGTEREICAPKKSLRWTQRFILDRILARVPLHPAAHGFVPGRSTVTNAAPHLGAALLVKFDLKDFFPTITSTASSACSPTSATTPATASSPATMTSPRSPRRWPGCAATR